MDGRDARQVRQVKQEVGKGIAGSLVGQSIGVVGRVVAVEIEFPVGGERTRGPQEGYPTVHAAKFDRMASQVPGRGVLALIRAVQVLLGVGTAEAAQVAVVEDDGGQSSRQAALQRNAGDAHSLIRILDAACRSGNPIEPGPAEAGIIDEVGAEGVAPACYYALRVGGIAHVAAQKSARE